MRSRAPLVALLLFASGGCALVYEVAWLRMLRMVFGTSTAASAATLAAFLGGLGMGGLLLGRRADQARDSLRLYARLEAGVALTAAASPFLIALVGRLYVVLGGTATLGLGAGTGLRLVLSALVLGLPTVLMGGTLPAATRAVERAADRSRRDVGLLYGANTIGAVTGSLCATFFALETLGTRMTVWSASLLNLMVALAAGVAARRPSLLVEGGSAAAERSRPPEAPAAPVTLVLIAAAAVGFAFLLMELVWYRTLAPLLGGSSYTFGLILAVALLGIGLGGLLYAAGERQRRPTLVDFSAICALEAVCIALPYALGDRVALLAMALRPLGFLGFTFLVGTWTLVTLVVVLPSALLAGYQFPLLVGLLGTGARRVGREVGLAYACNTGGAILGSLAGGFGLIPLLSALGVWRAVVYLLLGVAAVAGLQALRDGAPRRHGVVLLLLGLTGLLLCRAEGPTAVWRHSPIGAGRLEVSFEGPADLRRFLSDRRRRIVWEADGVESTVALDGWDGYAFLINGKNDGNAIGDAATQVMLGLVGAIQHRDPKRALVIGLGTGSTAGWLARVPSVERVDVVELEPAILHVAAECGAVNQDALANPKVHVVVGDGREFLLTTSAAYDLIVSEPSNPYRAGIASLFTREFYDAAARRLRANGIFVQWVQAYEVEAPTLRTIYATLGLVFPAIETWEGKQGDLLLSGRRERQPHDLALLAARAQTEPYRSALALAWGVGGVEGLYTGFVGNPDLADALRHVEGTPINTDDRTLIEFQFARTVGRTGLFSVDDLRGLAAAHGSNRPAVAGGAIDWATVAELGTLRAAADGRPLGLPGLQDPALLERVLARRAYASGDLREAQRRWLQQQEGPKGPMDVTMLAELLALSADPAALDYVDELRALQPVEAEAVLAQWDLSAGRPDRAAEHLRAAFLAYRRFPWAHRFVLRRSLDQAWEVGRQHPELGGALFDALAEPFAVRALDGQRISTYVSIGLATDFAGRCASAFALLEPFVPWERRILEERDRCYTLTRHPLADRARADLATFRASSPAAVVPGLVPGGR